MSEFRAPARFGRAEFNWGEGVDIRKGCAVKYKAFADAYLLSGDAADSAIKAGYSKKSARQKGYQLLNIPKVKEYIYKAQQEMDKASIANASEVMQYLTAVMRGEIKDQFDLEPALSDRTRAAVELAKRLCDVQTEKPRVVIVNNIPTTSDLEYKKKMQEKKELNKVVVDVEAKILDDIKKDGDSDGTSEDNI